MRARSPMAKTSALHAEDRSSILRGPTFKIKETMEVLDYTASIAKYSNPETTIIYISTKNDELYTELECIDMDSVERFKRSLMNIK